MLSYANPTSERESNFLATIRAQFAVVRAFRNNAYLQAPLDDVVGVVDRYGYIHARTARFSPVKLRRSMKRTALLRVCRELAMQRLRTSEA